ncbi:Protein of unknown function [Gryllus bimaculatus]|nr:Protein of unknown function [Gryllus bimaculatus]
MLGVPSLFQTPGGPHPMALGFVVAVPNSKGAEFLAEGSNWTPVPACQSDSPELSRFLELLQPEPSWRRGHLFALHLRWMALKVSTKPVFSSPRKQREMAENRDRLLELLQPEPSWRRGHLFAQYLRWMAFMGAHSGPRPRRVSSMQWAMRALIGFLHALTIYFLLGEWLELFLNSKDINDYISKAGVCLTSTCAAYVVAAMMNVGVPTIGSMVTLRPPVRFWHPIDVYSGTPNLIVLILVNATGAFWGFNMAAFSATFVKLVLTLCAQLDELSKRLLRVGADGEEEGEGGEWLQERAEGQPSGRMAQEVAEVARRHQELLRFLLHGIPLKRSSIADDCVLLVRRDAIGKSERRGRSGVRQRLVQRERQCTALSSAGAETGPARLRASQRGFHPVTRWRTLPAWYNDHAPRFNLPYSQALTLTDIDAHHSETTAEGRIRKPFNHWAASGAWHLSRELCRYKEPIASWLHLLPHDVIIGTFSSVTPQGLRPRTTQPRRHRSSPSIKEMLDKLDYYITSLRKPLECDSETEFANMKTIDRYMKWYVAGTLINCFVPSIGSLILMKPPVNYWHPIDMSSGVRNAIVVVGSTLATYFWAFSMAVFQTIFIKLVLTLCAELENLSMTLEEIGHDERLGEGESEYSERMKREIGEAARRHQMLLE